MAGLGAAINTGSVERDDTVAVIGCGGVGDAAIAGARLVGAEVIVNDAAHDAKAIARSKTNSVSCRPRPSSTPDTATPPPSATRSSTTRNGSPAATELLGSTTRVGFGHPSDELVDAFFFGRQGSRLCVR